MHRRSARLNKKILYSKYFLFTIFFLFLLVLISPPAWTLEHIFLIDNSGSMKNNGGLVSIPEYKRILEDIFSAVVTPNDHYKIYLFDTDTQFINQGSGQDINPQAMSELIINNPDTKDTNLRNALITALREVRVYPSALIWLLTDNMADTQGTGPNEEDIKKFYEMLKGESDLKIVYAYPRVISDRGFMLYGIYYLKEPLTIEHVREVDENLLGTPHLKEIFNQTLPIKIKPKGMNTLHFAPKSEIIEEDFYKSQYDPYSKKFIIKGFKEGDDTYDFHGKVSIASNFNHHIIKNADVDVSIDHIELPKGIEMQKGAQSRITPHVIAMLTPHNTWEGEIHFSIPKPKHHFQWDTFLRDITSNSWLLKSALNVKIKYVDIELDTQSLPPQIFGSEFIPSIFKPEMDVMMDSITIPIEFHIKNSAKFLLLLIASIIIFLIIISLIIFALTRRTLYPYYLGGEERKASLALFRSIPVMGKDEGRDLHFGYLKRGLSGVFFEPGPKVDIISQSEDGTMKLRTGGKDFSLFLPHTKTLQSFHSSPDKSRPESTKGKWV